VANGKAGIGHMTKATDKIRLTQHVPSFRQDNSMDILPCLAHQIPG
jgi:hypothetical protein